MECFSCAKKIADGTPTVDVHVGPGLDPGVMEGVSSDYTFCSAACAVIVLDDIADANDNAAPSGARAE